MRSTSSGSMVIARAASCVGDANAGPARACRRGSPARAGTCPEPEPEPQCDEPTTDSFELSVKTLEKKCFGSAGCNVTFRSEVAAIDPLISIDLSMTYELTYDGPVTPWAAVVRHSMNNSVMSGSRSGSSDVSIALTEALATVGEDYATHVESLAPAACSASAHCPFNQSRTPMGTLTFHSILG